MIKNSIKKLINLFIQICFVFIKSPYQRASLITFLSKKLVNKHNSVEFDAINTSYWLKHQQLYLYLVKEPRINFSKQHLDNYIHNLYCAFYSPKIGDVVIDIGAGVGTETLFFSQTIGQQGKLYSLEASKKSYQYLVALCTKNHLTNTQNFNVAVSGSNEKMWIEETDDYQLNRINQQNRGVEIEALTLDQFVSYHKINTIDFLKVNIEGAELAMIEGMGESVKRIKNVAISCHDFLFDEPTEIKKSVVYFLEKNNFEVFYLNTGKVTTDSWIFGKRK